MPVHGIRQDKRQCQCHEQGKKYDKRRVHAGKPGDKFVNIRLAGRCIFHRVKDSCDHRLFENLLHTDLELSRCVHTAGYHAVSHSRHHRNRLSRHRRRINPALTVNNHAVQRNPVARAHQKDIAHVGFLRVDHLHIVPYQQIHDFRPQIDRIHDLRAALLRRSLFKIFADAVEQHHADCLRKLLNQKGADSRQTHEEVLVKDLPFYNISSGSHQYLSAENQISDQKDCQQWNLSHDSRLFQNLASHKQRGSHSDRKQRLLPDWFLFFFFCCRSSLLWHDGDPVFHSVHRCLNRRNHGVRILRRQLHLFCGKCDRHIVHTFHVLKLRFNLRRTVRTVKSFHNIKFRV